MTDRDEQEDPCENTGATFSPMSSTDLLALAEKEWTNRAKHHDPPYDKRSWISGWFDGYFCKPKRESV